MSNNQVHVKLNQQVANLSLMYTKLHNYHWYVKGPQFFTLHEKFEELYNEIAEKMDAVAERLLTIGGKPYGTLKELAEHATIKEAAGNETANDMLKQLIKDLNQLTDEMADARDAADEIGDEITGDLLLGMIGDFEKHVWMLSAYIGEEVHVHSGV